MRDCISALPGALLVRRAPDFLLLAVGAVELVVTFGLPALASATAPVWSLFLPHG
jgi:hypothetical protein